MTLQERHDATKKTIDTLLGQQQQILDAKQRNAMDLLRADAELALLESLLKEAVPATDSPEPLAFVPKKRGRKAAKQESVA